MSNGINFREMAVDLRGQLTAVQSELAALREELAESGRADHLRQRIAFLTTEVHARANERDALQQRLTAAEQRNATLVEAAYKEGFSDGYSRGDSRERLRFVDSQNIDWDESDAKRGLKPTESGASE